MPDLHEKKISERINLVNEFLAEGIKRILEGEMDEMMVDQDDIEGLSFYVPGEKGEAG